MRYIPSPLSRNPQYTIKTAQITASFINPLLMFVMTVMKPEFKADHGISLSLKTLSMQLPSYKGITCSNMPPADVSRNPPGCSLPTQKNSACCVQHQQARESWGYNNVAVNHTVWACVRRWFSSVNRLWASVDTSTTGASNVDYCALSASEGSKQGAVDKTSLASVCLNSKVSLDPRRWMRQSYKKSRSWQ